MGLKEEMANEQEWLKAELADDDDLAEAMFARAVKRSAANDPSADFVERAAQAAWRARLRQQRARRIVFGAAAAFILSAGIGVLYALWALAGGMLAPGIVAAAHGLVWVLTSPLEGANWWWTAERVGGVLAGTVTARGTAAAIIFLELAGLAAIYAFGRVIGPQRNGN